MKSRTILDRNFFSRETTVVARDLLGKILRHGDNAARIREVEAYLPSEDLAAHSAAGLTKRTRVIYGPPGHAYVYLNYGIYHLLNVVVEPEGVPGCVLIRAADPVEGITERMSGPGLLTRAMGITLAHYGADLTVGPITVGDAPPIPDHQITITPRIGIRKDSDRLLRFLIAF